GGIRFRFRAQPGLEAWVRDLAAREKACCAFFTFSITTLGEEVRWDAIVINDDIAHAILDEFYALPDTVARGFKGLYQRFSGAGLQFNSDPAAAIRDPAKPVVQKKNFAERPAFLNHDDVP
ncbi:MAG TPA: hypothetical protein VII22_16130, partial [Streptosporangiaceae bacterium]